MLMIDPWTWHIVLDRDMAVVGSVLDLGLTITIAGGQRVVNGVVLQCRCVKYVDTE